MLVALAARSHNPLDTVVPRFAWFIPIGGSRILVDATDEEVEALEADPWIDVERDPEPFDPDLDVQVATKTAKPRAPRTTRAARGKMAG